MLRASSLNPLHFYPEKYFFIFQKPTRDHIENRENFKPWDNKKQSRQKSGPPFSSFATMRRAELQPEKHPRHSAYRWYPSAESGRTMERKQRNKAAHRYPLRRKMRSSPPSSNSDKNAAGSSLSPPSSKKSDGCTNRAPRPSLRSLRLFISIQTQPIQTHQAALHGECLARVCLYRVDLYRYKRP